MFNRTIPRFARLGVVAGIAVIMATPVVTASAAFTNGSPPLINHGGRTQASVLYSIFWGQQWVTGWPDTTAAQSSAFCEGYYTNCTSSTSMTYSNAAATAMTYINGFLSSAVPGSTWIGSQAQYGASASWGGTWTDTADTPPPPGVVTDNCTEVCTVDQPPGTTRSGETLANLLGSEALNAEAHFGYSPNADYMIYLPRGSNPAGFGAYCAYHNEIYDSAGNRISYSVMPYLPDVGSGCGEDYFNNNNAFGNGFLDGYSIVSGHELAETATDALPLTNPAWRDSSGDETGDICAWGTQANGVPVYNISGGGHVFAVQSLWSNSANNCV